MKLLLREAFEMKRTAKFIAKIADVKSLNNTANGNAMFEITLSEVKYGVLIGDNVIRTRPDYAVNCMIGTHLIGKRAWLTISQPRKNLLLDDMVITD
jgi:hypothetical protein